MPGSTLTLKEMAAFAQTAGFSVEESAIAAAIGIPESGGNIYAEGDTDTPYHSYGWLQIRLLPERKAAGATPTKLYDPLYNAGWGYTLFKSGGWNHWTAYRSGAYLDHLEAAKVAAQKADSEGAWDIAQSIEGIAQNIGETFGGGNPINATFNSDVTGAITGWITGGLQRVGIALAGAVLILITLWVLLKGGTA